MHLPSASKRVLHRAGIAALLLAIALPVAAAKTRADCEKIYTPQSGQSGKDVIWYPTDDSLVSRMLALAKVTSKDVVYDLGSGDGRIPITAAKQFGAKAIGIEFNPDLVRFSRCLAEVAGVQKLVEIREGDIFRSDLKDATVITLYLLPDLNLRLRPTLLDMKPGTRVVSHSFTMAEWEPDATVNADAGQAYLWIVPAKVNGRWTFRAQGQKEAGQADEFTVELEQTFQQVNGKAGGVGITDAKLNGPDLDFSFTDGNGPVRVAGRVDGDRIHAKVTRNGKTSTYVARRS